MEGRVARGLDLQPAVHESTRRVAADAESRIGFELRQAALKVVRLERDTAVQLCEVVPEHALQLPEPRQKRLHSAAGGTAAAFRPVHHLNPSVLAGERVEQRGCTVGRAVVDDHPAKWSHRLVLHRLQRPPDVIGSVAGRRDHGVERGCVHGDLEIAVAE
jgi:hypothetical protein